MIQDHALAVALSTDPGLIRTQNEDAVFVDARLGLAILADGMGGYNAGEVASGLATNRLAADLGHLIASSSLQDHAAGHDAATIERHILNEDRKSVV